jgi:uroporphyrinogen-III synthase
MAVPRTLLLTRPRAQSEAFAEVLAAELPGRFRAVVSPILEIVPVAAALDLDGLQGLIFTSANGVEQFAARTPERSLPAWCVGEMTAAAAREAGFEARSADGAVDELAALVVAGHRPGAGGFLHVRGAHAAGDLVGRLAAAGVPARAAAIYDQVPRPLSAEARALLAAGGVDVVTFFSPRTARLMAEAGRGAGWDLSRAVTVALSPAADAAFGGPEPALRRIAAAPTRAGMLAALAALL